MPVRTYRASSISDAVNRVKQELGPDAMILSVRNTGGAEGISSATSEGAFEITVMPAGGRQPERRRLAARGAGEEERLPGILEPLRSELMSIKEIVLLLSGSGRLEKGFRLNPDAIIVYGRLIRSGIAECHAQAFMEKAGVFDDGGRMSLADLNKRVLKAIAAVVEIYDPFDGGSGQVIIALIGPTGVGKTTTIAKLAADLTIKEKKKVGLISIDNYRIGAIDQLGAYAGILGIPCTAAFNRSELESALQSMKVRDVILIDTAGHGHYDAGRVEALKELIDGLPVQTHLVISAVTNGLEMERVAENFGRLDFKSYVFTKIDETRARGAIINQILRLRMPVSFITTGQRVPEDIVKATRNDLLRMLFK